MLITDLSSLMQARQDSIGNYTGYWFKNPQQNTRSYLITHTIMGKITYYKGQAESIAAAIAAFDADWTNRTNLTFLEWIEL